MTSIIYNLEVALFEDKDSDVATFKKYKMVLYPGTKSYPKSTTLIAKEMLSISSIDSTNSE